MKNFFMLLFWGLYALRGAGVSVLVGAQPCKAEDLTIGVSRERLGSVGVPAEGLFALHGDDVCWHFVCAVGIAGAVEAIVFKRLDSGSSVDVAQLFQFSEVAPVNQHELLLAIRSGFDDISTLTSVSEGFFCFEYGSVVGNTSTKEHVRWNLNYIIVNREILGMNNNLRFNFLSEYFLESS